MLVVGWYHSGQGRGRGLRVDCSVMAKGWWMADGMVWHPGILLCVTTLRFGARHAKAMHKTKNLPFHTKKHDSMPPLISGLSSAMLVRCMFLGGLTAPLSRPPGVADIPCNATKCRSHKQRATDMALSGPHVKAHVFFLPSCSIYMVHSCITSS